MTSSRAVTQLSIEGLAYLFSPYGLPLIDKGAPEPTTSIAVSGEAGAGKTTLAVALAHAISKELGRSTLYITTELAGTELVYKLQLLSLGDTKILSLENAAQAGPGDIISHHVVLATPTDTEDALLRESSPSLGQAALLTAWTAVEHLRERHVEIGCIAIDAFPLRSGASETDGRELVVSLMQAIEGLGISIVVVQEATAANDYLPFVTDIVFDLRFHEDDHTGALLRRLACKKSRYASSLAGPHATGLDFGRPAIWPDPLAVEFSHARTPLDQLEKLNVFLAIERPNSFVAFAGSGLLISPFGGGTPLIHLLSLTPGAHDIQVQCGPVTIVADRREPDRYAGVPDSEGPYSLAWTILKRLGTAKANLIFFHSIEILMQSKRSEVALLHMLQALKSVAIVCIHGPESDLKLLTTLSDMVWKKSWRRHREFPKRYHRSVTTWLALQHWTDKEGLRGTLKAVQIPDLAAQLREAAEVGGEQLSQMIAQLSGQMLEHTGQGTLSRTNQAIATRNALALHALGAEQKIGLVVQTIDSRFSNDNLIEFQSAWAWCEFLCGYEWHAARSISTTLERATALPTALRLLWTGFTALYAKNEDALGMILAAVSANAPVVLDFVLRTLAASDKWDDVDRVIANLATDYSIDRVLVERLLAESRLEGTNAAAWHDAARRLARLNSPNVPVAHRAWALHNCGVALRRLGKIKSAVAHWSKALELNPSLEIAARCLEAPVDVQ